MPFSWDPTVPGCTVRLRDNPGRQGMTTGHIKQIGSFLMVEVYFGPTEKVYKRYDLLEPVEVDESISEILASGRFGVPMDLRRTLTFEKVKGELTNVFYSMESSNTVFYPHQFKAVLKFIESPVGRLLIADEVGLGKTIESIYIWKELQARQDARRLLVVCPAMLREKWRDDLAQRFGIVARVVSGKQLLERMTEAVHRGLNDTFVYITSLEGLRPPANFANHDQNSVRARFARLLDQNTATTSSAMFDLVIIDEAHHLRNPATANNRLGRLLRDSSLHLVLLTATPIQISSDNLYQILRLIDPDQFYDSSVFAEMLRANEPLRRALRALWRQPPDEAIAADAVADALRDAYFANDPLLRFIGGHMPEISADPVRRMEAVRLLESRSLLGQYMTRSRKREVLKNKVQRAAQVLRVTFTDIERAVYRRVTSNIREQSVGRDTVSQFALIMRQRQMASSLVAAIESWKDKGHLDDLLWEDLGHRLSLEEERIDDLDAPGAPRRDFDGMRTGNGLDEVVSVQDMDIETLEAVDGKYSELFKFLTNQLRTKPTGKIRRVRLLPRDATLPCSTAASGRYSRRSHHGGMGEEKYIALRQFREPPASCSPFLRNWQ